MSTVSSPESTTPKAAARMHPDGRLRDNLHGALSRTRHALSGFLAGCLLMATNAWGAAAILNPVSDAYVNDSDPNGVYNNNWLVVGKSPDEFTPRYRSFLRFDLSGIPSGAVISSAVLRMNLQAYESTVPVEIELRRALAPWDGATLTWNDQPASTLPVTSTVVGATIGMDYPWSLSSMVRGWIAGQFPNYGLELRIASESTAKATRTFASLNHSNAGLRPELVVNYSVAPDIAVSPLVLAFGSQPVGTVSAAQIVTVLNQGGSTLWLSNLTSSSSEILISGAPPFPASLAPGTSGTFQVRFGPLNPGVVNATVIIASNDPDQGDFALPCSGTGVAPKIETTPATLTFGNQLIDSQSVTQTVTIRNLGSADLHLSGIESSSPEYLLTLTIGFPATVAPDGSLAVGVSFAPVSAGLKNGTITLLSDDPEESTVTVSCAGLALPELPRSTFYGGLSEGGTRFTALPQLDLPTAMSLEAWVRREDPNRTETIISDNQSDSFWFGFAGPRLRFYRSGGQYADSIGTVTGQRWTHVAAAYDSSRVEFFIDGEPAGVDLLGHSGAAQVDTVQLGNDEAGANLLGSLDEIRLWDYSRTEQQIREAMFDPAGAWPGLRALFPSGGAWEAMAGLPGQAGPGVVGREISVLREPLRIPRAIFDHVTVDGEIDPAGEYLGAAEIVIGYDDGPDAVAYLVHDGEAGNGNLYVAFSGLRDVPDGRDRAASWAAVGLDPRGSGAELASHFVLQFRGSLSADLGQMFTGDGAGGFSYFDLPPNAEGEWHVDYFAPDEFGPPNIEFRIPKSDDWLWREPNRLMLGHFNLAADGDNFLALGGVVENSPATWPEAIYVENSNMLPLANLAGYVWDNDTSHPVAGQVIELADEQNGIIRAAVLSDVDGRYEFNRVPVLEGHQVLVRLGWCEDCLHLRSRSAINDIQPVATSPQSVVFPEPGEGENDYARTDFYIRLPLGPVVLDSYEPTEGVPRLRLADLQRKANPTPPPDTVEGPKVISESVATRVIIRGANLHPEIQVYLYGCDFLDAANGPQPLLGCHPDVSYFEARITDRAADESWVEVEVPHVPRPVLDSHWGSDWAWVVKDNWVRPQMLGQVWTRIGGLPDDHFTLLLSPYPLVSGFEFDNESFDADWDDFAGVFGENAYTVCALDVYPRDPLYIAYFPLVWAMNGVADGSCNGMAATSLLLHRLEMDPEDGALLFGDDDTEGVHFASGFQAYRGPAYVDRACEPARPKNLVAHIRKNHLVQFSAEYIQDLLDQMVGGGLSIEGDPALVLDRIREHPADYVISMIPEIGQGHVVTPYEVVDSLNGDGEFTLESSIIRVYDNNFPNETNRFIEITPRPDRSSYKFPRAADIDDPATRWGGRWAGQGIYAIPIDVFDHEHTMPGAEEFLELTYLLVVGGADAHYTDDQGGEWGWRADGSVVDHLPGARSITPVGGPNSSTRNVMLVVPSTNPPPDIAINVRSNHYTFHVANGGRLFQLERRDGVAGDTDHMNVAYEAGRLAEMRYTPQQGAGEITARAGYKPASSQSVLFELTSLEVPAGGTVALGALPAEPGVELRNESSVAMRPVLAAHWSDELSGHLGTNRFRMPELAPGAVQRLLIQDWPLVTQLRVETDLDRDGTPDLVDTRWADTVAALWVEMTPDGQQLTLSWPLTVEGWQLEAAPALDGLPNLWSPVIPPYATNLSRITVTLPVAESNQFFRLRNSE